MFERFTERARQVLTLAKNEAQRLNSTQLDVGHILLGCLDEKEGLAGQVLNHLGVYDYQDLLRSELAEPRNDKVDTNPPFTSEAKKVLELALRAALKWGHNYIGTEHILQAITLEPGSAVETFLRESIDSRWEEHIQLEIMELLKPPKKDADLSAEDIKELDLKDVLADLMIGFDMWRDSKVADATWTDEDEAFSRWVEGSKVSEFL